MLKNRKGKTETMWRITDIHKQAWTRWREYLLSGVLMGIIAGPLGSLAVIPSAILGGLAGMCCFLWPVAPFVGFVVAGIYTNVLGLGVIRFYLGSLRSHRPQSVGQIFWGFGNGHYTEQAKTLVMRNVFVFLWSLLFCIPGIVKSYEYSMIPYLMTDHPEKTSGDYFNLSKEMMTGNKGQLFFLDLSFAVYSIPVILLGMIGAAAHSSAVFMITGVLLLLFLISFGPVWNATRALVYDAIYEDRFGIRGTYQEAENVDSGVKPQDGNGVAFDTEGHGEWKNPPALPVDPPTTPMQPKAGKLYGVEGEFKGADLTLQAGETLVIGRDSSVCNLVVNSDQVSRKHVTLEFDGSIFFLTDHSTNGTYDLERGPFKKECRTAVGSGTYIQLGTRGDIFRLEIR